MKQLKPYKELIWEIVKANDKILNARKLDRWYSCIKCKPIFDIEATTASGERYVFTLWNDNTLLYSIDGVTEMHLTRYCCNQNCFDPSHKNHPLLIELNTSWTECRRLYSFPDLPDHTQNRDGLRDISAVFLPAATAGHRQTAYGKYF